MHFIFIDYEISALGEVGDILEDSLKIVQGLPIQDGHNLTDDPCKNVHCSAGRECVINYENNEAKCECIKECAYETHPRRMV